jgi:DNA polymerase-3 subunit delta'
MDLAHPDLHWMAPVLRPKAADPDKQVEEMAELQGQLIAERREQPLYGQPEGLAGHFAATARLIQKRAAMTPAVGPWKVFIIGHAERLVPQESSPDAANALLKLFEEPPADTLIVLTATDLGALLPTIRSRAVPLRLGRLTDGEVGAFIRERVQPEPTESDVAERVRRAEGAIGRAFGDPAEDGKAREAAHRIIEAVLAGAVARAERTLQQGTFAARGEFTAALDALSETLADAAREATGHPAKAPLPKGLKGRANAATLVEAAGKVTEAREAAQGNVNPQLLLGVLIEDLAEALCA